MVASQDKTVRKQLQQKPEPYKYTLAAAELKLTELSITELKFARKLTDLEAEYHLVCITYKRIENKKPP